MTPTGQERARRYRRKSENIRAIQFDGTNVEECRALVGYSASEFARYWKPTDWAVEVGRALVRDHYLNSQFRDHFEPVRADLAAPGDRERRFAEFICEDLQEHGMRSVDEEALLKEARAVLASPGAESVPTRKGA